MLSRTTVLNTTLEYEDFELLIGIQQTDGHYPVAVIRSPAGEARGSMRFSFSELELENRLLHLRNALLLSGEKYRDAITPEKQTVRQFGHDLFTSIMDREILSLYDSSYSIVSEKGKGLRLKLRIQSPQVATLPWEFLFDSRKNAYISLSRNTPIVRYLELPQSLKPLETFPPLRILGMVCSPTDQQSLNVQREKQRLENALTRLAKSGLVEFTWLEGQTWRDLQRVMRSGPWHIFHFIGHGNFDEAANEGVIVFEDEQHHTHLLSATQLAQLLSSHQALRLVILNSCRGAQGSQSDIFASTASTLVRQGIPAVIAMQYVITDQAATEFSHSLYEALADGLPIDAAVSEARIGMQIAVSNSLEWGTPVLVTHSSNGALFSIHTKTLTEERRSGPSVISDISSPNSELTEKKRHSGRLPKSTPDYSQWIHILPTMLSRFFSLFFSFIIIILPFSLVNHVGGWGVVWTIGLTITGAIGTRITKAVFPYSVDRKLLIVNCGTGMLAGLLSGFLGQFMTWGIAVRVGVILSGLVGGIVISFTQYHIAFIALSRYRSVSAITVSWIIFSIIFVLLLGNSTLYWRLVTFAITDQTIEQIQYTTFQDADFRFVNFSGADLSNTNFYEVNFTGANLSKANLSKAEWPGSNLFDADLTGAVLVDAYLTDINLSKANLISADLEGANLNNANLSDANFTAVNLKNARLAGANLSGAGLTDAKLQGARYDETTVWPNGFDYRNVWAIGPSANLEKLNLSGINLSYTHLSNTNLSHSDLSGSVLNSADLSGANLSYANLSGADLSWTKLDNSILSGTILMGAALYETDLSGTYMYNVVLQWARYGENTKWPEGFKFETSGALGPSANLDGQKIQGVDLQNLNLSKASLRGAILAGVNLSGADLSGADLFKANLSEAILSNANLAGANLIEANLDKVDLTRARYNSDTLWPETFMYKNAHAIGPQTNLEGEDLSGIQLQEINLSDANLRKAILTHSSLCSVDLTSADLSEANLSQARLKAVKLKEAKLQNVVLKDVLYDTETEWPEGFNPGQYGAILDERASYACLR